MPTKKEEPFNYKEQDFDCCGNCGHFVKWGFCKESGMVEFANTLSAIVDYLGICDKFKGERKLVFKSDKKT